MPGEMQVGLVSLIVGLVSLIISSLKIYCF
uniref:Uncharacterized protein n=1 Tax=Rhizophora mucronata TaxID=61149 RepID=A0A2P2QHB0_RHIMU